MNPMLKMGGVRMNDLFEKALGIEDPWYVKGIDFDPESRRLDISVDFRRGALFHYELASEAISGEFPAYDTVEKTWRHLNFFQHECHIKCRTPRVDTGGGRMRMVSPPWAGVSSGFTMLFEALLLELCSNMPVNAVSRIAGVGDDKLWSMLGKYVSLSRESEDFSEVTVLGVDETSRAKGHEYVSLFVDMKERRTIYVGEGKDSGVLQDFVSDFKGHGGEASRISNVSCDMSPAFISGIAENMPDADITFDRFHVMKILNKAVDNVRRNEAYEEFSLRKAKYIFLKNRENLKPSEAERLSMLEDMYGHKLKSIRALHMRENFQDIYKVSENDPECFEPLLRKWYNWAVRSRLEPMKQAAKTIKKHWDGVVNWHKTMINNGLLEGLNSLIQAAKAKARGYRTLRNFKIIAYLITGNLNLSRLNQFAKAFART